MCCALVFFLMIVSFSMSAVTPAAPRLKYSTMIADPMEKALQYASDVDAAGNLYFVSHIYEDNLPKPERDRVRVYRVHPGGDEVSIFTEIPGYIIYYDLICGESGLYIKIANPKIANPISILKFDYAGNQEFKIECNSYPPPEFYVDGKDNLYLAVNVESEEDAALITTTPDAFDHDYSGGKDIVIQKYDTDGNLLFSSFLGGSEDDIMTNIKVDDSGAWYLYLNDLSADFPYPIIGNEPYYGDHKPYVITISPEYDEVRGYQSETSDLNMPSTTRYYNNAFYEYDRSHAEISKFSNIGEISWTIELQYETPRYGSYWGNQDWWELPGYDIYDHRAADCVFDVDTEERIYLVRTMYNGFPFTVTPDALYSNPPESGFDLGIWQVTDNAELLYGTYFGGSNIEETTMNSIVFRDGKLYVTGYTNSTDFPLTPGAYIDSREPEQFNWGIFAFCIDFNEPTGVAEESSAIPEALILDPPHPNPFNPATTISFTLPEAGLARLAIYNISGQLVRELTAGNLPAGRHEFVWDSRDTIGAQVGSGVYIARLAAGGRTVVRKVTLVR